MKRFCYVCKKAIEIWEPVYTTGIVRPIDYDARHVDCHTREKAPIEVYLKEDVMPEDARFFMAYLIDNNQAGINIITDKNVALFIPHASLLAIKYIEKRIEGSKS